MCACLFDFSVTWIAKLPDPSVDTDRSSDLIIWWRHIRVLLRITMKKIVCETMGYYFYLFFEKLLHMHNKIWSYLWLFHIFNHSCISPKHLPPNTMPSFFFFCSSLSQIRTANVSIGMGISSGTEKNPSSCTHKEEWLLIPTDTRNCQ